MATHSSAFAWQTPWTEEPDGLQSIGWQKSQTRLSDQNNNNNTCLERVYWLLIEGICALEIYQFNLS